MPSLIVEIVALGDEEGPGSGLLILSPLHILQDTGPPMPMV
jgi:hypothetical protein